MREIEIHENEAGQRFDKFLKKYLKEAPASFLYKMLRKKNIVLNGKKADGSEKLGVGDKVKLFLSEETIEKFSAKTPETFAKAQNVKQKKETPSVPVIYEDSQVLILNKPSGMLSQKAAPTDYSVNEFVISYLMESGQITKEELRTFRPAVCNRLDRNTSGIIVAGKTLPALQELSKLFKDRDLGKYYLCIVKGRLGKKALVEGYLKRDLKTHKVTVTAKKDTASKEADFLPIRTEYFPLAYNRDMTLLKVHLITGRTHQIRAHLSSIGHPIAGDYKYGDWTFNERFKDRFQLKSQLLHAYELVMPKLSGAFLELSEKSFVADVPELFWRIIKETAWEHGTQEVLEVRHLKI